MKTSIFTKLLSEMDSLYPVKPSINPFLDILTDFIVTKVDKTGWNIQKQVFLRETSIISFSQRQWCNAQMIFRQAMVHMEGTGV